MQNAVPAGGHISTVLGYLPLFFLIVEQCLTAQTGPPPENSTISVDVNLVVLHATVLDRKGGFVSGLQKRTSTYMRMARHRSSGSLTMKMFRWRLDWRSITAAA